MKFFGFLPVLVLTKGCVGAILTKQPFMRCTMQFDLRKFIVSGTKPYTAEFQCDLSAKDFAGARIEQPVTARFEAVPDGEEIPDDAAGKRIGARRVRPLPRPRRTGRDGASRVDGQGARSGRPGFRPAPQRKGHLDVDEWLCQEFMFQIPTVLLCSADCPGLCPRCGKKMAECTCPPAEAEAEPADARLAILKSLLN